MKHEFGPDMQFQEFHLDSLFFFSFILLALYLFRTLHPSPCQVSLPEKHFKDSAKISAMESEPHGAGQDKNMVLNSEEFWYSF